MRMWTSATVRSRTQSTHVISVRMRSPSHPPVRQSRYTATRPGWSAAPWGRATAAAAAIPAAAAANARSRIELPETRGFEGGEARRREPRRGGHRNHHRVSLPSCTLRMTRRQRCPAPHTNLPPDAVLVHDSSAHNGHAHLRGSDRLWRNGREIAVEDHKVGQHPLLYRPDGTLLKPRVRRRAGVGAQRLLDRDLLLRDPAAGILPVERATGDGRLDA